MLSDLELIQEFVSRSTQKKELLLANKNLIALTVSRNNQLTTKTDGIIAIAQTNVPPPKFLVQANSPYWETINNVLEQYSYIIPKNNIDNKGYHHYQYCQSPEGYKMHCSKAVMLWRTWWKYRQHLLKPGIPLELMIRTRDSWYPVRDITICNGLLYVKTLGNELAISTNDLIIWISKNNGSIEAIN
ncbi:hypothetical protein VB711_04490 [Cronbergia sp. UHCC 0137]|uniref:hypothetical protein n=1 Tax=Cronbergia sp. UHCC 0137 TaxID=3110239 RepID=UPI002B21EC3A|nr:hypothetical protein [Cronbergia sp. UHCC 0137]MEA5617100.1 hypothetical protein [Cronbergia sp. UHCC 0137]